MIQCRLQPINQIELDTFQQILHEAKNNTKTDNEHTIVIDKFNTEINYYKICCLLPNNWLNDEVILLFYVLVT